MHELTVRASHLEAPVRVRQSDPVIEADALVAREEARAALRERCLRVRRDQELRRLVAGDELACALVNWQAQPVRRLDVVAGSVYAEIQYRPRGRVRNSVKRRGRDGLIVDDIIVARGRHGETPYAAARLALERIRSKPSRYVSTSLVDAPLPLTLNV
jgi:hypothetical protein